MVESSECGWCLDERVCVCVCTRDWGKKKSIYGVGQAQPRHRSLSSCPMKALAADRRRATSKNPTCTTRPPINGDTQDGSIVLCGPGFLHRMARLTRLTLYALTDLTALNGKKKEKKKE